MGTQRPASRGALLPGLNGLAAHLQSKPVAPTMVNFGDNYDNTCPICFGPLRVAPFGVGNPEDLRDIDDVDLFRSSWKTATLRARRAISGRS